MEQDEETEITTHGGSAPDGSKCQFPFIYDGEKHKHCSRKGKMFPWCMTDDKGNWGYCDCKKPTFLKTDESRVDGYCEGSIKGRAGEGGISMIFDIKNNKWYR